MFAPVNNALFFLVNTLFDLYLFILTIRVILVYVNASYVDPLVQFITKITNFIVLPIRRVIPNIGRFEIASILLIAVIDIIKFIILLNIMIGMPGPLALIILTLGDMLRLVIDTFFYAIFIFVILSWIQPFSPATRTLYQFTAPVLQPFRRLIPPISGFDISPIVAIIFLQLLMILIVKPILHFGVNLVQVSLV